MHEASTFNLFPGFAICDIKKKKMVKIVYDQGEGYTGE